MIKYENIQININSYNRKYYDKLDYNTDNDIINVKISDIPKKSHIKIPVICDYCDNEKIVTMKYYTEKTNTNVIGAASKLLTYFIKNYKPNRIISYSDKTWCDGKLYYMLGFNLLYESKINYKYIVNNRRINKQHFTKQKLKTKESEKNTMTKLNIPRIYDCGQFKFEMILKNN